ncbi:hypothetical protein [Gordonia sp. FQ]|uniref:hypothetical protein n=1 Tax=Gordonia sp. FQ TaxID=3446634 RepID=UPI003F82BB9D
MAAETETGQFTNAGWIRGARSPIVANSCAPAITAARLTGEKLAAAEASLEDLRAMRDTCFADIQIAKDTAQKSADAERSSAIKLAGPRGRLSVYETASSGKD